MDLAVLSPCTNYSGDRVVGWSFHCPGCGETHYVSADKWSFNGDLVRPTFMPSLLRRSGHFVEGHKGECWCTYNAKHPDKPAPFICQRCHSYVKDGQIQFLADCSHSLAGKTVPLPPWPGN